MHCLLILYYFANNDLQLSSTHQKSLNMLSDLFVLVVPWLKASTETSFDRYFDCIKQIFLLTSWICQVSMSVETDEVLMMEEPRNPFIGDCLPVSDDWQSDTHKSLSRMVHNLCVSCSASHLSKWDKEELQAVANFVGATSTSSRVTGILVDDIAKLLAAQWIDLNRISPPISFDFNDSLSKFQTSKWYIDVAERRENDLIGKSIGRFGEKYALSMLLSFSNLCLHLAEMSQSNQLKYEHLMKYSLSIILPAVC